MNKLANEIKRYRTPTRIRTRFLPALLFAYWVSPYLSALCVKKRMIPNTITLLMIPTALTASFLFSINNFFCKIIGALLFHIWFAIDMSDGQVARFTSTFSKYGEELDYIVHHVCHVFFIVSFLINIYVMHYDLSFLGLDYSFVVVILGCLMVFAEYLFRNECSIGALIKNKNSNGNYSEPVNTKLSLFHLMKRSIRIIMNCFNCIDNYVLIGSIIVFFDLFFHTSLLLITTCLFVFFTMLLNAKLTYRYLMVCYKGV